MHAEDDEEESAEDSCDSVQSHLVRAPIAYWIWSVLDYRFSEFPVLPRVPDVFERYLKCVPEVKDGRIHPYAARSHISIRRDETVSKRPSTMHLPLV